MKIAIPILAITVVLGVFIELIGGVAHQSNSRVCALKTKHLEAQARSLRHRPGREYPPSLNPPSYTPARRSPEEPLSSVTYPE